MRDVPKFSEACNHRRSFGGGAADDDVEIADRFVAPPKTAGHIDRVDRTARLEVLDNGPRVLFGLVQYDSLRAVSGAGARDTLADLREQLGAEAWKLRDLPPFQRRLEIGDA